MSFATSPLDRRSFLRLSAVTGGSLLVGFSLGVPEVSAVEVGAPTGSLANAFLRIDADGAITLFAHKPEIGQGIRTSLPMLVAEELDVEWDKVKVVPSPVDEKVYGWQGAGGSSSTPSNYMNMRRAGATARLLLVQAAAARWSVDIASCTTDNGSVLHAASGRRLTYGDLVGDASKLPAPEASAVKLKDRSQYRVIGKRIGGVDNSRLVRGEPLFGVDQTLPGLLYAVYVKCPVFGGKPVSTNLDEVKRLPGVVDAFVVDGSANLNGLMPGVAIVAKSTWAAFSARKQLAVSWDEGAPAAESWTGFLEKAKTLGRSPAESVLHQEGDVAAALQTAKKTVEAEYSFPFLSHATLEPQNCVAHWNGETLRILAPSQNPGDGIGQASAATGVPKEKIHFEMTRIGGGFGRRLMSDFVAEAAVISMRVKAPVKLTWTREDDLAHDHYRPAGYFRFKGGVDEAGRLSAWDCHFVTVGNQPGKPGNGAALGKGEFPAHFVPNFSSGQTLQVCNVPMGWWRAPGSCTTAWVIQCYIDELAHAAGRDPLDFRLEILGDRAELPPSGNWGPGFSARRAAGVLRSVAEKAGWGRVLPRGQGLGIAFHFSHMGYVAQVAEVQVSRAGELKVTRVTCVSDVGAEIINPSGAENQVEGSIVDGLSAAWLQSLSYEKGRMVQSNFHEYRLLRINDLPDIQTHFLTTDHPVTGLGEPALPPLAPAVCNAIFAATGKRIRTLPIAGHDLAWS